MPQSKEDLFNAFVQWVTQHGWGVVYRRNPRQAVPPDCGFIRVRCQARCSSRPWASCSFVRRKRE